MSDRFNLSGQAALVTGGASGIGKAIARAIVEAGGRVWIGSRTAEKVDSAITELRETTGAGEDSILGCSLDVTEDRSVAETLANAVAAFDRLDILVNSAGIIIKKPTVELTLEEFDTVHESHVTGTLRCCKAAAAQMMEQGSGSIINIASISSFVDLVEVTAYAAAKSAILGLTRSLANEWAKHGIRTNAIAPGFIPTDLNRKFLEGTERGRRIIENTPMERFGTADEIAGAAVFLSSPAASFINGHTLVIDGGYLACGIGDSFAPWARPEE